MISYKQGKAIATIDAQASHPATGVKSKTLWHKAKQLLFIFSFFGLGSLNVLTLVSDKIHAAGYSVIRSILASAVPEAAASQLLSSSPTVNRQRDVAVATKKLIQEKDMLVATSKVLEANQVTLVKSFKEIEVANGALKRTSEARAAAVMKASKRLAIRSATNVSRNVSSVFAEAIPIVGTGIMLGVTAWDVHDACETLKDINELNSAFDHPQEDQTRVCGMKVPTMGEVMIQVKTNATAVYQSTAAALKR